MAGVEPERLLVGPLSPDLSAALCAALPPHWLADVLHFCETPLQADVHGEAPAVASTAPSAPPAREMPLPTQLAALRERTALAALLRDALRRGVRNAAFGLRLGDAPADFGTQRCGAAADASPSSPYESLLPPPRRRKLYRSLMLRNDGATPALLLSLRLEPPNANMSLLDDCGIAEQLDSTDGTAVLIPPGGAYEVTVRLHCAPKDAGGVLAAWLLATLVPLAAHTDAPAAAPLVLGRRVAAALLSDAHAAAIRACFAFNPDARPFRPAALRAVFDTPASAFSASLVADPLALLPCAVQACLHAGMTALVPVAEDGAGDGGDDATDAHTPLGMALLEHRRLRVAFRVLSRLLRLEESAQTRAMRAYDLYGVTLSAVPFDSSNLQSINREQRLFALSVPGLAENRPAVSVGDVVHLRGVAAPGAAEVAASVATTRPRDACVVLALNSNVMALLGARPDADSLAVHARFALDRTLFARTSAALLTELGAAAARVAAMSVTGSTPAVGARPSLLPDMRPPAFVPRAPPCAAETLAPRRGPPLNEEQTDAVLSVLNGHADGAPHVLYGPPGTGKTLTVVEAARQLLRTSQGARLLLCAPSPFAADILCSRLLEEDDVAGMRARVVRVNDPRRALATVKADVVPHCVVWTSPHAFALPKAPPGMAAPPVRVFVASCASAALLRTAPAMATLLPFDAVFVDEAGQATAAESLIPLCAPLTGARTAILLAGDPRQLGPVVHSRAAAAAGLACSLLERFAEACGHGDNASDGRRRITRLTRNYRSHADVLALPSALFYAGALQPCASTDVVALPSAWLERHGGGRCRVHFHGVRGAQARDADAPSWFNAHEAAAVVETVLGLMANGLSPTDIGVIATFRRQVQKVRELLRRHRLGAIRVDTVDDYQGQEERVIIISTVLSKAPAPELVGGDAPADGDDTALSFLANPRRFNVAVSRARALNIVIGHPVPLATWKHWRTLMQHALARGAYTGAGAAGLDDPRPAAQRDGEADDLATTLASLAELTLLGAGSGATDEQAGAAEDSFFGDEQGWKVAL